MPNDIISNSNFNSPSLLPTAKSRRSERIEQRINQALDHVIHERRIDVRPAEIYTAAHISRPTFYAHYRSCDDALTKYETGLEHEFAHNLSTCSKSDSLFTILLVFINRHHDYFAACLASRNVYLLTRFVHQSLSLASTKYGDRLSYFTNVAAIEGIIYCWFQDGYSRDFLESYLTAIRKCIELYSNSNSPFQHILTK